MGNALQPPAQLDAISLRKEWLSILEKVILEKKVADTLVDWLVAHPAYDRDTFWSTPDEKGCLPLESIFRCTYHKSYVLGLFARFQVKTPLPEEIVQKQFNTPNAAGEVFMHVYWKSLDKAFKERVSSHTNEPVHSDLADDWHKVMSATKTSFWLWLDEAEAQPASYLRQDMTIKLNFQYWSDMAKRTLDDLAVAFPLPVKPIPPKDSPWRYALKVPLVEGLEKLGRRLDEKVQVGKKMFPAWQWLLMSSKSKEFSLAVKNMAKRQGLEGEVESWKAGSPLPENMSWSSLSPDNRRAKGGYVATVLKFIHPDGSPLFDGYGRNPLDYLLGHRSDMFEMFASKAYEMDSETFCARYMQLDVIGRHPVLRMLPKVPDSQYSLFKKLLSKHGAWVEPGDLLRNEDGILSWESDISGWSNAISGYSGDQFPSKLLQETIHDPSVIFGSSSRQKEWNEWWEDLYPVWENMSKWLADNNNNSYQTSNDREPNHMKFKQAMRQLSFFLANSHLPSWKKDLNADLFDTLHLASCFLVAPLPDAKKKSWFPSLNDYAPPRPLVESTSYARSVFSMPPAFCFLSRNPPESLSRAAFSWIAGPSSDHILRTLGSSGDFPCRPSGNNFKEVRQPWDAWLKLKRLETYMDGAASVGKSAPKM